MGNPLRSTRAGSSSYRSGVLRQCKEGQGWILGGARAHGGLQAGGHPEATRSYC